MAVLDASVCVAFFNQKEDGHARSKAFIHGAIARSEVLRSPAIIVAEVAAALSRGVGDKDLARQAVRLLTAGWLELAPVSLNLAERASRIAVDQQVRGCDAIYLALAQQEGDSLVSWDRQQLERATGAISTHQP